MKIYKSIHETIYIGNTDVTIIKHDDEDLALLKISSVETKN
jgi:hypothetical protein